MNAHQVISVLLLVAISLLSCPLLLVEGSQNLRPIIGIMAQPPDTSLFLDKAKLQTNLQYPNALNNTQLIVASYVKWLESGGARVVPVFYNMSASYMDEIFSNINGLLFPGGGQTLDPGQSFFDTSMYFFNLALEANKKGDYFPLWGTCQGFQFLNIAASTVGNESALTAYNSWDYSWPLNFQPASKTSRMFGNAPSYVYNIFGSENVTMNWHHWGISPELYKMDSKLADFFDILSLNTDVNGKPFVSAVEGKNMPFYASQFHPEWPVYEWDSTAAANHNGDSIAANGYLAQFFVSEARKNNHSFATPTAEASALIYNFNPAFTEMLTGDLQTYYF